MSSQHLRDVAARLQLAMEALDISPADLNRTLGVSTSKVGNWLAARNYPDPYIITVFCDRYGVTMDYLYRGNLYGLPAAVADGLAKVRAAFAAGQAGAEPLSPENDTPSSPTPKRRGRKPTVNKT